MIDSEKIAQIRSKADIVRIVGTHVQLRKQGHRFTGLCPFHGEKSPSFSVSGDKGLFYCFGCHARGDVFSFVEQIQGLDFLSVARWLAKEVGVELEPESPVEAAKRKLESGIAEINRYVLTFFQHELWAKDGGVARKYLESRAIPEEQAKERGLGYGGNPGKLLAFLAAKKITIERAREAGLLNEQGDRSLFDERLIFPIVDQNGRIAGFGGRWLGDTKIDGERTRPKYVNTRESPLFSKRTLLYGWDVAQPTVRRLKRVTICEGYTDVLACQRAGIEDAVAALGTAFTAEHAALVKRLANDAIILLDSDAAGDRASKEAAEKCVNAGLKTLIAPLPAGDDPDSIVRKSGPQALEAFVKGARPAIEHFIDRAFAAPDMAVEDKARAAQNLWPLFKALGQSLERDLYMAQLANKVGVDTQQLEARLQEAEREERKKRPKTESRYADGRAQRADYRGPSGGRRFPTADGRSPSADHRGPRADGQPREDRFSDDDGPPPDDSYAPPPGWDGNSGPLPDGRSPMADHRRPGAPARRASQAHASRRRAARHHGSLAFPYAAAASFRALGTCERAVASRLRGLGHFGRSGTDSVGEAWHRCPLAKSSGESRAASSWPCGSRRGFEPRRAGCAYFSGRFGWFRTSFFGA